MSGIGRLRLVVLFAFVSFVLLVANTASADEENPGKPLKSTTGAVLRSLVIPGWGQLYTKSYIKAGAFAVTEGLLIYSASHENDQMMRFKTGGVFTLEKFYRNSRNKLLWWLAGTIMLSMGDAYVNAQLYKINVSPSLSFDHGTVGITVSSNF